MSNIKDQMGQANGSWAEEYHAQMFAILAPKGFVMKKQKNKKAIKVSNIKDLTEGRIKKAANVAHNVMKDYRQRVLLELAGNFVHLTAEHARLTELINKERAKNWLFRSKKLILGWMFELNEVEIQRKALNGIEAIMHSVEPLQINDAMIESGIEKLNEMMPEVKENPQ